VNIIYYLAGLYLDLFGEGIRIRLEITDSDTGELVNNQWDNNPRGSETGYDPIFIWNGSKANGQPVTAGFFDIKVSLYYDEGLILWSKYNKAIIALVVEITAVNTPSETAIPPGEDSFISTDNIDCEAMIRPDEIHNIHKNEIQWEIPITDLDGTGNPPTGVGENFTFSPAPPLMPLGRNHRALRYNICAKLTLNGTCSDTYKIQQDLLDILRQEYTADDCGVNLTPGRNILTNTQHSYLNYGTHSYWVVNWLVDLHAKYVDLGSPNLNSAYRNPVKQVSPPISENANSYHVYGAAIDYAEPGATPEERSERNYNVGLRASTMSGVVENILYTDPGDIMHDFSDLPLWPEMPLGAEEYTHGHVAWSG